MRPVIHPTFTGILVLIFGVACSAGADEDSANAAPPNYVGDLSCADCERIVTDLTLFPGDTFLLKEGYRGTSDGDKDYTTRGKYAFLADAANPDAGRILMLSPPVGQTRRFRALGDTALRQLDENAREFESSENVFLQRSP
jgi:hypothetical protein